ncbi:MAG: 16S rRNA (uracil(1498)-N(3))-methyltransferase, partial [Polyangiaceae bacterium]|nr:16S rRNA (uracil(1498)-N(3))-methyltransferase [Polyangiaceae bacterium]
MSARRLFAPSLPLLGGEVGLGEEAARHARVLRLAAGDAIELFDGEGLRALGTLEQVGARELVCRVDAPIATDEPLPRVHLILGLPKSGTLDDAIRAATEAGASSVHLLVAGHSVGRHIDRAAGRLDRLERVVREASRQCERDRRPVIHAPAALPELVERIPSNHLKLVASARDAGAFPS